MIKALNYAICILLWCVIYQTITIKFFKKVIVIKVTYNSQYSLWGRFGKANWGTSPHSLCKGLWCTWNGIIAWDGKWIDIYILSAH